MAFTLKLWTIKSKAPTTRVLPSVPGGIAGGNSTSAYSVEVQIRPFLLQSKDCDERFTVR